MALGLTFVVIAGEIDISVASILAVSVVVLGQVYESGREHLVRRDRRAARRHGARAR